MMSASILIAYATRGGSTAEVASAIGAATTEAGLDAKVLPVSEVESLAGWSALVLGAPLYCGRFPREFHRFFARHRESLTQMRPWCFVLGPTRTDPADFEAARKQAEKQLSRYSWLQLSELKIFAGRWDVTHLTFPFSVMKCLPASLLRKIPSADVRDWIAIRVWAFEIVRRMKPAA